MQKDPRFSNKTFSLENPHSYLLDYAKSLETGLKGVDAKALKDASDAIAKARVDGKRIFVAGNGGSSAIADHLDCDWKKGCYLPGKNSLQVSAFANNTALMTAIANDFSYEKTFSFQLELADPKPGEIALLISCSGNSPNIVAMADVAKSKQLTIIGLTGFSGGKLKAMADISLHVAFDNYGVVEDSHQALMHILAQYHDLKAREQK